MTIRRVALFVAPVLFAAVGIWRSATAQSIPKRPAMGQVDRMSSGSGSLSPQQDVEKVKNAADAAWSQAADEVLASLQSTPHWSSAQMQAMRKAESGLNNQQKFKLRLDGLTQLVKR